MAGFGRFGGCVHPGALKKKTGHRRASVWWSSSIVELIRKQCLYTSLWSQKYKSVTFWVILWGLLLSLVPWSPLALQVFLWWLLLSFCLGLDTSNDRCSQDRGLKPPNCCCCGLFWPLKRNERHLASGS